MPVGLELFRLGTANYPVWDGAGAAAYGGRWNPPGAPVIYAAGALSLAMLERLMQRRHLGQTLCVAVEVPDDVMIEDLMTRPPSNWRALGSPEAVAAGGEWIAARRTPLLRVPSALVPREPNYLVNPAHPDTRRIRIGVAEKLEWDARLFGVPSPT
ncbi:RES family NAD+ phosphorylase [Lichenicoccus sp.]|uniref:RES family NAD+ phosphorylase n=1 Tax=Lichenicoccus sp. TaxID=2781899 RepID=UPI003D0A8801